MSHLRVVAIHQPNFYPWLGFFNKMVRADVFVLLDNVQFPKTGGTWVNRVQVLVNGEIRWATMPIVRAYHGVKQINEVLINNSTPWRVRLLKTIRASYARAPFFAATFCSLAELIDNPSASLCAHNTAAIRALAEALGQDVSKLVMGSSLSVQGNSTDLLIAIVRAVGGTAYLCGGGAALYQDDAKFGKAGVALIRQRFEHPIYPQVHTSEFIPGLSVIDALMNCGVEGVKQLVRGESLMPISANKRGEIHGRTD